MTLPARKLLSRLVGNDPATGKPVYAPVCPTAKQAGNNLCRLVGFDPASGKPVYAMTFCLPENSTLVLCRLVGIDPATGKPVYAFVEDCCESSQGSSSSSSSGSVPTSDCNGSQIPLTLNTTLLLPFDGFVCLGGSFPIDRAAGGWLGFSDASAEQGFCAGGNPLVIQMVCNGDGTVTIQIACAAIAEVFASMVATPDSYAPFSVTKVFTSLGGTTGDCGVDGFGQITIAAP